SGPPTWIQATKISGRPSASGRSTRAPYPWIAPGLEPADPLPGSFALPSVSVLGVTIDGKKTRYAVLKTLATPPSVATT
ncbi:MAG: hypothetical protein ACR2JQ_07290, partial [Mycobacteriales bacterium]